MTEIDASIRKLAKENTDFRREAVTGTHSQVVLMSLLPGEAIGDEVHDDTDQIFVVVKGEGEAVLGDASRPLKKGELLMVTAGTPHNIRNTGDKRLRLVSIYSPPHHAPGTVHATREEAMRAEAGEEGNGSH